MKILITGVAGFIGFNTALRLLKIGTNVVGVDNLNNYYDVGLKKDRLIALREYSQFRCYQDHCHRQHAMKAIFEQHEFDVVLHLAAQAGVQYAAENPHSYIDSNCMGFTNILEGCVKHNVPHLIYASSSSVYGKNELECQGASESDEVTKPASLYAVTKRMNELAAWAYGDMFGLKSTGLRFFTVYGPWGRPDMAIYKFADAMVRDKPIKLYNHGNMERDFTFIDDVVEAIRHLISAGPSPDNTAEIYNVGKGQPDHVSRLVYLLEQELGIEAKKEMVGIQPGEVYKTWADVSKLQSRISYHPSTTLKEGIEQFVNWYKLYHGIG